MPDFSPEHVRRGTLPPAELMVAMQDALHAATRRGGAGIARYPDGDILLPPDIDNMWIIISGQGSSSSSDVSQGSTSSGSTTAAGTTNRYRWNQIVIRIDPDGTESAEIDPSGLSGTQDVNPAIELKGNTKVPQGAIVRAWLSPSQNAWLFVYHGAATGDMTFTVDCAAGTIVVGTPTTPTTPTDGTGTGSGTGGDNTTTNNNTGGRTSGGGSTNFPDGGGGIDGGGGL